MRVAVIVLNILSSLTSMFWMVWLGLGFSALVSRGRNFDILNSVAIIVPFLIILLVCVVASTKRAHQGRASSVFVSLVPVLVITILVTAYMTNDRPFHDRYRPLHGWCC